MSFRQLLPAVCKSSSMHLYAGVVAAMAIAPSAAFADLTIAVEPLDPVAPARVMISAASLSEDPIVSYRWTGLPNAPRCKEERCAIEIPVASCTAVELEVVTVLGETFTATRALCAKDALGGQAPRLVSSIDGGHITTRASEGSDPLKIRRTWVDGVELDTDLLDVELEEDGGCHAVDVFVADRAGRIALSQKTVCFDADAPQLWAGGRPSAFVRLSEELERCAESAHPLGLTVTQTDGDLELDRCETAFEAPRSIERAFVAGTDSRGAQSFASAFYAGTPPFGPPTLFFAEAAREASAKRFAALRYDVDLFGGSGPYTATGVMGIQVLEEREGQLTLGLDRVGFLVGKTTLEVTLRDGRGLEAHVTTKLTVENDPSMQNPGMGLFDSASGCTCVARSVAWPGWPALIFALSFLVLWRRR